MAKKMELKASDLAGGTNDRERAHGALLYASRLCRQGKFDEAVDYCKKAGIAYPPGAPEEISVATESRSPAEGHGEQGEPATGSGVATMAGLPIETAPQAPSSLQDSFGGLASCAGGGASKDSDTVAAPSTTGENPVPPTTQEKEYKALIFGSCINNRLMKIQLVDTGKMATMIKIRKNYGRNDIVNVTHVEGEIGSDNATYKEIWRPL
jgi:hypothetical protein